jgi:2'-hydroxyisoflavone reductase
VRILVIGGIQFMGRGVVERLLARDHEVTVLHRRPSHDLGPDVGNVQADRNDVAAVARVLRDGRFEVVYDIAYDWERGTTAEHVEAAARSAGPDLHRYVFMSSVAAYGPGTDWRESDPLAPDEFPAPYIQHKASSERALFRLNIETGLLVSTFRPPYVHGPRQPFYREQYFWDRLQDGRPIILPEDGEGLMQWAFVDDVAEALVRAIEVDEAAGEAFNIGHLPISQRDYVALLARVAGVEPRFAPVPRERIEAEGGSLFGPDLYFGEALDMPEITSIVDKAPRVLGIEITDFETAVRAGFEWYRSQPRRPVDYAFEDRLLAGAPPAAATSS